MRLEPSEPTNESGFYAGLSRATLGRIFYERIEPSNESGFPDIHFVLRDQSGEGTIELKYADTQKPNLRALSQGTQKAAILEYSQAGGQRRFALCYCNGYVYLWDTDDYRKAILGDGTEWTDVIRWDSEVLCNWLVSHLRG